MTFVPFASDVGQEAEVRLSPPHQEARSGSLERAARRKSTATLAIHGGKAAGRWSLGTSPGPVHLEVITSSSLLVAPGRLHLRFTVGVATSRSCVGFEGEPARPSAGSRPLHSAPASRPFGVLVRAAPSGALDGAALETTGATWPDGLLVPHELGVMASVISSHLCGVGWLQTAASLGDQRAAGRDEQVGLSCRLGAPPVISLVVVPGAFVLHERREETCGHLLGERHGDRVGS